MPPQSAQEEGDLPSPARRGHRGGPGRVHPALEGLRLDLANAGKFFLTSDQFHLSDNYAGPQPLGWLLRDHAAWWRSCRKVKMIAERIGARLVFGHDADVLAELKREKYWD
jgi:glyoxylase-like metal-dependent hydrolase (beta-lactamase superfamily II)